MAETLTTIEKRKSIRAFKPEQVPTEAIKTILKAGSEAPIAMGAFDTIHFTVVQDAAIIKRISEAATRGTKREGSDIFYGAPTVIIVSSAKQLAPGLEIADAGAIVENFLLAATDIGIGSVYIFGANSVIASDPELLQLVGIPDGFTPVSSAVLGYATEAAAALPKRKRSISVNWV
ncbi:MAG: nitroreductase family protein [Bacteroidales bacterium]|jgi:nitroreductase|nr:nitroreductase family protein [Bacteroidales bacterium]